MTCRGPASLMCSTLKVLDLESGTDFAVCVLVGVLATKDTSSDSEVPQGCLDLSSRPWEPAWCQLPRAPPDLAGDEGLVSLLETDGRPQETSAAWMDVIPSHGVWVR